MFNVFIDTIIGAALVVSGACCDGAEFVADTAVDTANIVSEFTVDTANAASDVFNGLITDIESIVMS